MVLMENLVSEYFHPPCLLKRNLNNARIKVWILWCGTFYTINAVLQF